MGKTKHSHVRALLWTAGILLMAGVGATYFSVPKSATKTGPPILCVHNGILVYEPEESQLRVKATGKLTWRGRRTGEWTSWWDNGRPREKGSYSRFRGLEYEYQEAGIWRQWDRSGRLVGECEFQPITTYHFGVHPARDETYVTAIKGQVAIFDRDGILERIERYDILGDIPFVGEFRREAPKRVWLAKWFKDTDELLRQIQIDTAPIMKAAGNGDVGQVKPLISRNPDLTRCRNLLGLTPLHVSARAGQTAVSKLLLDNGADVMARGGDVQLDYSYWRQHAGETPLHAASEKGHEEVVRLLLDYGADIKATMNNGSTPLSLAERSGNTKLLELLRQPKEK